MPVTKISRHTTEGVRPMLQLDVSSKTLFGVGTDPGIFTVIRSSSGKQAPAMQAKRANSNSKNLEPDYTLEGFGEITDVDESFTSLGSLGRMSRPRGPRRSRVRDFVREVQNLEDRPSETSFKSLIASVSCPPIRSGRKSATENALESILHSIRAADPILDDATLNKPVDTLVSIPASRKNTTTLRPRATRAGATSVGPRGG